MNGSARLNLPFLSPGQAQKEAFHNEALQTLDLLVAPAVEDTRSDPPATVSVGACYIIGDSPTGDWAGKSQCIAGYTSGGWRFIAACEGMSAYVKATGTWANFRSATWEIGVLRGEKLVVDGMQVVGSRVEAIPDPTGGVNVDTEARDVIGQILAALRQHGLIES